MHSFKIVHDRASLIQSMYNILHQHTFPATKISIFPLVLSPPLYVPASALDSLYHCCLFSAFSEKFLFSEKKIIFSYRGMGVSYLGQELGTSSGIATHDFMWNGEINIFVFLFYFILFLVNQNPPISHIGVSV